MSNTQEALKMISALKKQGVTVSEIVKNLNTAGYTTPTGLKFTDSRVSNLINNTTQKKKKKSKSRLKKTKTAIVKTATTSSKKTKTKIVSTDLRLAGVVMGIQDIAETDRVHLLRSIFN